MRRGDKVSGAKGGDLDARQASALSPRVLSWRERFLIGYGPGVLAGITLGDWLTLLRENGFSVDPPYLPRAVSVSFAAVTNSVFRWYEDLRYAVKWKDLPV